MAKRTEEYNLEAVNKELAKEWDEQKNKEKGLGSAKGYTPHSHKKVYWRCSKKGCDHRWQAKINNRSNGSGCPACAGKVVTSKNNLEAVNKELAKEWDKQKNKEEGLGSAKDYTPKSGQKVYWRCSKKDCDYPWQATIANRSNGSGCPACVGQAVTSKNNLEAVNKELAKEWDKQKNKEEGLGSAKDYTPGADKKVYWRCSKKDCGHRWQAPIYGRSRGKGCPACAKRSAQRRFVTPKNNLEAVNKELAKEWDKQKNKEKGLGSAKDYTPGSDKKVYWRCSKKGCDHRWQAKINDRSRGKGCPACAGRVATSENNLKAVNKELAKEWDKRKNKEKGLGSAKDYTPKSGKKVYWRCFKKDCDHRWQATIANRSNGNGCPACAGRVATSENNLKAVNKELAKEWDKRKNKEEGLGSAKDYTPKSGQKVYWRCSKKDCGHRWPAAISSRSRGRGCPACAEYGYNTSKPGYLYISIVKELRLIKFGITNRGPKMRVKEQQASSRCTHRLIKTYLMSGQGAKNLEDSIKTSFRCDVSEIKFNGSTETIHLEELEALLAHIESFLDEAEESHTIRRFKEEGGRHAPAL